MSPTMPRCLIWCLQLTQSLGGHGRRALQPECQRSVAKRKNSPPGAGLRCPGCDAILSGHLREVNKNLDSSNCECSPWLLSSLKPEAAITEVVPNPCWARLGPDISSCATLPRRLLNIAQDWVEWHRCGKRRRMPSCGERDRTALRDRWATAFRELANGAEPDLIGLGSAEHLIQSRATARIGRSVRGPALIRGPLAVQGQLSARGSDSEATKADMVAFEVVVLEETEAVALRNERLRACDLRLAAVR